jgi:uncharacterized membrane protein
MIVLAAGVFLFAAFHVLPAFPAAEQWLKHFTGERLYGPTFGLLSVVALVLIVLGWRMADFVPVYDPPEWGRPANFALTLIAFVCLGIFIFRGTFRQSLRFPLAIGVTFWATGHLLANGDLASLILFGGMLAYAILYIAAGLLNGVRPSPDVRAGHDLLSVLIGVAFYGVMTQLHPVITGVPILALSN